MSKYIRLNKGLDIPLKGEASPQISKVIVSDIIAVKPSDFKLVIPKLLVKEGDVVQAGSPVFADKKRPQILFTSPCSGTVTEVVRGEKRKILEIRIKADAAIKHIQFNVPDIFNSGKDELKEILLQSGLWTTIRQRPYGIIANPEIKPKAIFISGFDSAPLAPNLDFTLKNESESLQAGINLLSRFTTGGIHLSLNADNHASSPFHRLEKTIQHTFSGPHPAGNVGVQINHISPINKGEIYWTIDLYAVAAIGKLFLKGIYDVSKVIAVTGPRVKNPSYIKCLPGMAMSDIADMADNSPELQARYISGNVLTGDNVGANGFLGYYHNQVTLISEGNYHELFGWAKPFRLKKFSFSHAYFSWLSNVRKYSLDSNLNGGQRAFITSDIYQKVLPMDIYATHLLKAILAGDIDKMEELGIYEVIEEDFALCEYVCPSKIDIQQIIAEGIELMIKEMA